jgi:hypothetical protein
MDWDSWESKLQEARRMVGEALGFQPGLTLDVPFGFVEIRLPGGRRRLRGCLRTGLWRLVEDEVSLSGEMPLDELLKKLQQPVNG